MEFEEVQVEEDRLTSDDDEEEIEVSDSEPPLHGEKDSVEDVQVLSGKLYETLIDSVVENQANPAMVNPTLQAATSLQFIRHDSLCIAVEARPGFNTSNEWTKACLVELTDKFRSTSSVFGYISVFILNNNERFSETEENREIPSDLWNVELLNPSEWILKDDNSNEESAYLKANWSDWEMKIEYEDMRNFLKNGTPLPTKNAQLNFTTPTNNIGANITTGGRTPSHSSAHRKGMLKRKEIPSENQTKQDLAKSIAASTSSVIESHFKSYEDLLFTTFYAKNIVLYKKKYEAAIKKKETSNPRIFFLSLQNPASYYPGLSILGMKSYEQYGGTYAFHLFVFVY